MHPKRCTRQLCWLQSIEAAEAGATAAAPAVTQVHAHMIEDKADKRTASAEQEEEQVRERGQAGGGGYGQELQGSGQERIDAAQAALGAVYEVCNGLLKALRPWWDIVDGQDRLACGYGCDHGIMIAAWDATTQVSMKQNHSVFCIHAPSCCCSLCFPSQGSVQHESQHWKPDL